MSPATPEAVPEAVPEADERSAGPKSKKGARTRERMLAAAKEVFEEQGFLDARTSDIAVQAGLSHGSFYYYFDSKEEIFREVAAAVDEHLSAPLGEVILTSSSVAPEERLREALRRHFESYAGEARILGVIEQVSRYDDEVQRARLERHHHYTEQMAESIRQLQKRGMADETLDPVVTATALGALTLQFGEMWLVQGLFDLTLDEAVDQVVKLLANVLSPSGPALPRS